MPNWAVIIGFGNPIMSDDGAGVAAIDLFKTMPLPAGVDLAECGTSSLDAIPFLEGKKLAILIDTVRAGGEPGAVYRFTAADLRPTPQQTLSLHSIRLVDSMQLWELQLGQLPEIVIYGIEPQTVDIGLDLSPPVRAALPKLCEMVLAELRRR
jgi:hydrogenase maturation protease